MTVAGVTVKTLFSISRTPAFRCRRSTSAFPVDATALRFLWTCTGTSSELHAVKIHPSTIIWRLLSQELSCQAERTQIGCGVLPLRFAFCFLYSWHADISYYLGAQRKATQLCGLRSGFPMIMNSERPFMMTLTVYFYHLFVIYFL